MRKTETNPEKYEIHSGCFAIILYIFATIIISLMLYFFLWNT